MNLYSLYFASAVILITVSPTNGASDSCTGGDTCPSPWNYCPGKSGATCVNEMCRCLNNPMRDECTCLSIVGGCHIESKGDDAAAIASYDGNVQTSYHSCVTNDNCDNEVHILGSYESSQRGFQMHPVGYANVYLTVTSNSTRDLILVLSSYEHVQWTLHIPTDVVISKVIISSYLNSSVVYPPGKVLSIENNLRLLALGSDSGGGSTHELLTTIYNRFGPITSFTGSYRVDDWRLNIKQDPGSDCLSSPFPIPSPTTSDVPVPQATTGPLGNTTGITLGISLGTVVLATFLIVGSIILIVWIIAIIKSNKAISVHTTASAAQKPGSYPPQCVLVTQTSPPTQYTFPEPPSFPPGPCGKLVKSREVIIV